MGKYKKFLYFTKKTNKLNDKLIYRFLRNFHEGLYKGMK